MSCQDCGLYIHSDPSCIPGKGSKKARIMIINSSANDRDEMEGHAVIGKTLLSELNSQNISLEDVYYTNLIKCRTPKGNKIKVSEIKKCAKYLYEEIEMVKPEYMLVIGAQALKAFTDDGITSINGVVKEWNGIRYVPTYSPGIIYRDPGKYDYVVRALNTFGAMIEGVKQELPELNVIEVKTVREVKNALKSLKGKRKISYDIEARGLSRHHDAITLLGFGDTEVQYILPLEVKYSPLRGMKIAQKKLARIVINGLNDLDAEKSAANGKFDDLYLHEYYGVRPTLNFDTMLASHCLDENTPNGLKENAVHHCRAVNWDIKKHLKTGNVVTKEDYEDYKQYLGYDIYFTNKLHRKFKQRLRQDQGMWDLFYHLYMPAALSYEDVQMEGVYVNQKQFKDVEKHLKKQLKIITRKLNRRLAKSIDPEDYLEIIEKYKKNNKGKNCGINWSSDSQIKDILFNYLNLPIKERTEAGQPSVNESALMQIRDLHKLADLILEYRGVHIQISHFIDGWTKRMVKGRLYPNFRVNGTVTGRPSSNNPNLQQVPRDPIIRNLIASEPHRVFVEIDLSQAEVRIATIMSGDDTLINIYATGGDVHSATYEVVTGEHVSDDPKIRKAQRKKAKAVVFGFLYGMGWKKFKQYARDTYELKLTDTEAKQYRTKFFETYSKLPLWHDRQRKIVRAMKEVRSLIGRVRRLPDIDSSEGGKRSEAERQAINSPVQGFGSDITLMGFIEIMGRAKYQNKEWELDRTRFACRGTVHDAILCEVDPDYLHEFSYKAKMIVQDSKVMSKVFHFKSPIPIVADVTIGTSWGSGTEIDMGDPEWRTEISETLEKYGYELSDEQSGYLTIPF